jgi:hypothetical protein
MSRWLLNTVWLVASLAAILACDSTARISKKETKFQRIIVVSGVPLVESGGTVAPSCEAGPTDAIAGFDLNFVLQSTDLDRECFGEEDRERAILPGDRVLRNVVDPDRSLTQGNFTLNVRCVEPYPDLDSSSPVCDPGGVTSPSVNLERLEWEHFHRRPVNVAEGPQRCQRAAVAVLISQSGGMVGFVNPQVNYQQDQQGLFQIPEDTVREAVASDPNHHRFAAVVEFIEKLNARDELVVFGFKESQQQADLKVLCTEPPLPATGVYADEPEYVRQGVNCFGHNRGIVRTSVREGYGEEQGRTPLWDAVAKSYQFLRRDDVRAEYNRHIVVITDSPDTCNAEADEFLSHRPQCSDHSFAALKELVVSGNERPDMPPTRIHFVQIQSRGYMRRDARMQELSCLSGGHHIFINAHETTRSKGTNELLDALSEAMTRIRYSISGHWKMRFLTAAFKVGPNTLGYLPPGRLFSMGGEMTLLQGLFVERASTSPFDVMGSARGGDWDQRVAFRRACDADSQCVAGGAPEPCQVYCSESQRICLDPPLMRPNRQSDGTPTTCTTPGGQSGICCDGVCQEGACGASS